MACGRPSHRGHGGGAPRSARSPGAGGRWSTAWRLSLERSRPVWSSPGRTGRRMRRWNSESPPNAPSATGEGHDRRESQITTTPRVPSRRRQAGQPGRRSGRCEPSRSAGSSSRSARPCPAGGDERGGLRPGYSRRRPLFARPPGWRADPVATCSRGPTPSRPAATAAAALAVRMRPRTSPRCVASPTCCVPEPAAPPDRGIRRAPARRRRSSGAARHRQDDPGAPRRARRPAAGSSSCPPSRPA